MKAIGARAAAAGMAALLIFVAGCSGGGSGGSGSGGSGSSGAMFITTCSLGCGGGQSTAEVTCSIVDIPINADIYAVFSEPVDPNSLNDESFNVKDAITSAQPAGNRFVDPTNPRRVVFRPAIAFVNGTPQFALSPTSTYKITIASENGSDPGPFITSTGGKKNTSLMRCSVKPIQGVTDVVAGPPTVDVLVSLALVSPPVAPSDILPNQDADGATDVWRDSTIRFVFHDIMNPASVLDQSSGQPPANGISIKFDIDGDLDTVIDQVALPGEYRLDEPDLDLLRTELTFTASAGLPSAGVDLRQVVVEIPPTVQDLVGNSVAGPNTISFTPEVVAFADVTLPDSDGENFANVANEDALESGAAWGGGRLQRGIGGGAGRLGALHIVTGQTITLNTDNQSFPLPGLPPDILVDVAPGVEPSFVVTNGIFEFSSLLIEPGGTLVFEGTKPARVFSRGTANIQAFGVIDLSGGSPDAQLSDAAQSNAAGIGGPGAGDGGLGADRFDNTPNQSLILNNLGGIENPGAVTNGQRGGPVGRDAALEDSGGGGGLRFPLVFPSGNPTIQPFLGGLRLSYNATASTCICFQVASGGGGGGYAQDGRSAFPLTPVPLATDASENLPAHPASGGFASAVGIEAPDPESAHDVRKLRFETGDLRGGSGGGGGGAHLYGTTGAPLFPCTGPNLPLAKYFDHSAGSGGGGGGALQLVAGSTLSLSGKILSVGGNGGNAFRSEDTTDTVVRQTRSAAGGAGSGGAVRVQGENVVIDLNTGDPARIDVRGGFGGTNASLGIGGRGGHGLVRIEDTSGALSRVTESPKIAPFVPGHINPATGLAESENVVSVGEWISARTRPESFSGSVSCWMKPAGNYFRLIFTEDDVPNGIFGWSMDVYYDAGSGELLLKYRDEDANSPFGTPLEDVVGLQNGLNAQATQNCVGDYFAIRFQGARAVTDISADPCNVVIAGSDSQIELGSLTPWVSHPAELNDFEPRVNMIRFVVVFDGRMITCGAPATSIKGLTNIKILATPD